MTHSSPMTHLNVAYAELTLEDSMVVQRREGIAFPPRSVRTEGNDYMNRPVRSRMPSGVRARRL